MRRASCHEETKWLFAVCAAGIFVILLLAIGNDRFSRLHPAQEIYGHGAQLKVVAFSPKGDLLASGGTDSTVKVWNLKSKQLKYVLGSPEGHTITAVAFTPSGSGLFTVGYKCQLRLWDMTSGMLVRMWPNKVAHALALSPDGAVLVLVSTTVTGPLLHQNVMSTIAAYSTQNGKQIWSKRVQKKPQCVAISKMGLIAVGYVDGNVQFRNLSSGKMMRVVKPSPYLIDNVEFSPDGKTLAVGAGDFELLDVDRGTHVRLPLPTKGAVTSTRFLPNGLSFVTATNRGYIDVWDARTRVLKGNLREMDEIIESIGISGDGKRLAIGLREGSIQLCDLPRMA